MSLPVSLTAVVQEMDVFSDEWHAYLNKRTGKLVTVSDEEPRAVEEGMPLADLPHWQRDAIRKTAEVFESDDFIPLPSKFDIHEYFPPSDIA